MAFEKDTHSLHIIPYRNIGNMFTHVQIEHTTMRPVMWIASHSLEQKKP